MYDTGIYVLNTETDTLAGLGFNTREEADVWAAKRLAKYEVLGEGGKADSVRRNRP